MTSGDSAAVAKAQLSSNQRPFWHASLAKERKDTLKSWLPGIILITAILWIALPIFWGSNLLLLNYFHRLTILSVNFDDAVVGPAVIQILQEMNDSPMNPHLGSINLPASAFPGGPSQVKDAVKLSHYWGAIVTYSNCTSTWITSLQVGNTSYDPTGCVGIFLSGARFYQITLLYLLPFMQRVAGSATRQASSQALQSWLTANASNTTALALAATVPQALATPFSFFSEDVAPINQWSAAAPFEAGLIYLLILSFEMATWFNAGRDKTGWNQKVQYPWLVLWRIGLPMFFYVFVSLMFSLLFVAFQIPTDGVFNSQSGFVMLWLLNYLCLCCVGLALESMMALLTSQYIPFFLICWVILNITSSFQPIEVMHVFYRWMRALPFYNTVEAYKVLFYGTRTQSSLGLFYGVLVAILFINFAGIAVFVAVERIRDDKSARKQLQEKEAS